jgi:hypothetical protein
MNKLPAAIIALAIALAATYVFSPSLLGLGRNSANDLANGIVQPTRNSDDTIDYTIVRSDDETGAPVAHWVLRLPSTIVARFLETKGGHYEKNELPILKRRNANFSIGLAFDSKEILPLTWDQEDNSWKTDISGVPPLTRKQELDYRGHYDGGRTVLDVVATFTARDIDLRASVHIAEANSNCTSLGKIAPQVLAYGHAESRNNQCFVIFYAMPDAEDRGYLILGDADKYLGYVVCKQAMPFPLKKCMGLLSVDERRDLMVIFNEGAVDPKDFGKMANSIVDFVTKSTTRYEAVSN